MRKLLVLFLLFLGCAKDDVECNCDLEVVIFSDNPGSYTITNVPTDCKGNYDLGNYILPEGHVITGTKNCD